MANLAVNKITGLWKTTYETVVQLEVAVGSQTSSRLYLLSQGKDTSQMDILSADCNRDSVLYKPTTDSVEVMHNMYDMNDIWYHNQAARRHRYPYETYHDYQHIYRRPDDQTNGSKLDTQLSTSYKTTIFSLACAGNTLYGLDNLATFGHSFVNDEIYNWLLNDNGWPQPPTKLLAASLYTAGQASAISNAIDESISDQYFTEEQISSMTSAAGIYALSGIVGMKWNTIYEIPGNIKQDYSKGELIANTFKAKNQFDGNDWSMNHNNNEILTNTREYLGIYSCGGQIWLKWKDNRSWKKSTSSISTYPDMYGKTNVSAASNVAATVPFPQIETFAAINRGVQAPSHKSTLYSLKLKTRLPQKLSNMLDETSYGVDVKSEIKEKLKLELQVCMRKIAENIAPANCQMFSATIDG